MTSLIQLAPELEAVMAEVMEAGGDVSDEELAERLNTIAGDFKERLEAVQMVARKATANAAALASFTKPYLERRAQQEALAERMKRYAYLCLTMAKETKVETPLGGARIQKNSKPTVTVTCDPETLPIQFTHRVVTPDKEMLATQARLGMELPEGVKVEYGSSLRWL